MIDKNLIQLICLAFINQRKEVSSSYTISKLFSSLGLIVDYSLLLENLKSDKLIDFEIGGSGKMSFIKNIFLTDNGKIFLTKNNFEPIKMKLFELSQRIFIQSLFNGIPTSFEEE